MAIEKQILHSKIINGKINSYPPLLICHGVFGMLDNWMTLGLRFSENTEVHLLDMRNHGRSFHAPEMNYELMALDLLNYCNHHNLEKIYLLGHSMGGKVAMVFATQNQELCEKLVVVDIAPRPYPPHHQSIIKGLNSLNLETTSSRKQIEEELSVYIQEIGVRQFLLKNVYRKESGEFAFRFNLSAVTKNYESIISSGTLDKAYTKDTLFVKGSQSDYITLNDEFLIREFFPKSKITTIESGHWVHADNPEVFLQKTNDFLFS